MMNTLDLERNFIYDCLFLLVLTCLFLCVVRDIMRCTDSLLHHDVVTVIIYSYAVTHMHICTVSAFVCERGRSGNTHAS